LAWASLVERVADVGGDRELVVSDGNFQEVHFDELADARAWARGHVAEFRGFQREVESLEGRMVDALGDVESRLRELERRVWFAAGAAAAVGTVGGVVGGWLL
jgi:hypothetical protein